MAENNPSDGAAGLFSELPIEAQMQIKNGLRIIANMSDDSVVKVVDHVKKAAGLRRPPFEKYATTLNISLEEVVDVLSSAMVTASLLSESEISAEEFGQRTVDDQFIEAEDKAAISRFGQAMLDSDVSLRERLERARISTLFIPSFVSLDTMIDMRFRFKEGHVQAAIPVAVVRLSTDDSGSDEEMIFQVTRERIEEIIEPLQNARRDLQAAEEWAQQKSLHEEGE